MLNKICLTLTLVASCAHGYDESNYERHVAQFKDSAKQYISEYGPFVLEFDLASDSCAVATESDSHVRFITDCAPYFEMIQSELMASVVVMDQASRIDDAAGIDGGLSESEVDTLYAAFRGNQAMLFISKMIDKGLAPLQ